MDTITFGKQSREAIKTGDLATLEDLLRLEPQRINELTIFGSLLHVAAGEGNIPAIELLLKMGADINQRGGSFEAGPIMYAVSDGHLEAAEFLIVHGAIMETDEPFRNPLFSAVYNDNLEMAQMLIRKGIDFRIRYTGENMKNIDAQTHAHNLGRDVIAHYLSTVG
jgi:ankyrin repeat protein